jgi:hypothetical protein
MARLYPIAYGAPAGEQEAKPAYTDDGQNKAGRVIQEPTKAPGNKDKNGNPHNGRDDEFHIGHDASPSTGNGEERA